MGHLSGGSHGNARSIRGTIVKLSNEKIRKYHLVPGLRDDPPRRAAPRRIPAASLYAYALSPPVPLAPSTLLLPPSPSHRRHRVPALFPSSLYLPPALPALFLDDG